MPSLPVLRAPALLLVSLPALLPGATPDPTPAQLLQDLRSFATTGTVLHVGAHPDDENTELITYLSRGRGYRTGYLSLTRGEGGQNELGKDFDEKLGVLRTQELLAARQLDGGHQFFTRAIDFGYSKTPEETLRFWDRDQVLADVVRIYRKFRPDVVVTRFPIPPGSGGHGQHTASAILAVEAWKISGDPSAYPEQVAEGLQPWQPKRVLWNSWAGRAGGLTGPTFTLDIAGTDPVTGEAFGLIAARSRAMHKTQGLAGFINRARTGANEQVFMHLAGEPATADLMDGVESTWARFAGGGEVHRLAEAAAAGFDAGDLAANLPALLAIRAKLAALPADPVIAAKRDQLDAIIAACAGVGVHSRTARSEVRPGERLMVGLSARAARPMQWIARTWERIDSPPPGPADFSQGLVIGAPSTPPLGFEYLGDIPTDRSLTHPYWLRAEGAAGVARVDDPSLIGLADNPPTLPVHHYFKLDGQVLRLAGEVTPTGPDGAPLNRRLAVIAPVSLSLDADVLLVAPGQERKFTIEVMASRADTSGTLSLELPAGWSATPASHPFSIPDAGGRTTFTFTLTSPSSAGTGRLTAFAEVGGRRYSHQRIELRYDHLPVQLLQPPATARLVATDVATRGRVVGYLPGAGDSSAEALAQLGYEVRPLTGADLSPEKLAGLAAVVIGVRAFNEREDLKDNLPGLFAWVEQGGTVIAQYNRPSNNLPPLGPYELSIAGPAPANRVTDETAPVTFLAPDHPVLNTPNKITAADFTGWVQERSTYQPSKWDESRYTSILAISDPGEQQPDSSLLIARHGRGHYVYASLAFFRQLPAGVPGAYRLFANLVSLGQ